MGVGVGVGDGVGVGIGVGVGVGVGCVVLAALQLPLLEYVGQPPERAKLPLIECPSAETVPVTDLLNVFPQALPVAVD